MSQPEIKTKTGALTSLARVKNMLGITSTGNDDVLKQLINAATDYIERATERTFSETTYTNKEITTNGRKNLMLPAFPVSILTQIEYRAGTSDNPNWTSYSPSEYILEDADLGLVRKEGGNWPSEANGVRATFTAGYKIDFDNVGDLTKHTLPEDISATAARIVARWWARREKEGRTTETFNGATITWDRELNQEDKDTIERYKRPRLLS
jgi:uncharacterized phiE125 gp8 family phage protein